MPLSRTPALAHLPPEEAARRLQALGEEEAARQLLAPEGPLSFAGGGLGTRGWQHTAHVFGYIPLATGDAARLPVKGAGRIAADRSLMGQRLRITLDGLVAADYPGGGVHQVLVELEARHQAAAEIEPVRFGRVLRTREGSQAATSGLTVFAGIVPGTEGLALSARTVNVKSEGDEGLLGLLESEAVQTGLGLIGVIQPALVPLVGIVGGLAEHLLTRARNVVVQDLVLGLDLGEQGTRARLAEGTYVAMQVPEEEAATWRWERWAYNRDTGRLVTRDQPDQPQPYNALLLGVSRMRA